MDCVSWGQPSSVLWPEMESNRDRQNLQEPNNFDGSRLDRLQVAAEWKHAAMNESILRRETKSGLGKSFLQIETREWGLLVCWQSSRGAEGSFQRTLAKLWFPVH